MRLSLSTTLISLVSAVLYSSLNSAAVVSLKDEYKDFKDTANHWEADLSLGESLDLTALSSDDVFFGYDFFNATDWSTQALTTQLQNEEIQKRHCEEEALNCFGIFALNSAGMVAQEAEKITPELMTDISTLNKLFPSQKYDTDKKEKCNENAFRVSQWPVSSCAEVSYSAFDEWSKTASTEEIALADQSTPYGQPIGVFRQFQYNFSMAIYEAHLYAFVYKVSETQSLFMTRSFIVVRDNWMDKQGDRKRLIKSAWDQVTDFTQEASHLL